MKHVTWWLFVALHVLVILGMVVLALPARFFNYLSRCSDWLLDNGFDFFIGRH